MAYFRIKELKDILTQLGLSKQGKKQVNCLNVDYYCFSFLFLVRNGLSFREMWSSTQEIKEGLGQQYKVSKDKKQGVTRKEP